MSPIRRNLIANVAGRAWSTLSVYLFVPFYLDFLGIEAYALVTLYAILLNVLVVADLGVKATLSREMARLSTDPANSRNLRDLLRTVEVLLWVLSLAMAIGLVLAAPLLANRWVNPERMDAATLVGAFRLMGLSVSLFFLSQLYQAGLLGLQRHVLLNSVLIGLGVVRGFGSILVLWLFAPTITAFFTCQVAVNGVQAGLLAVLLWRSVPRAGTGPRFRGELLRSTWQYTVGMALISLNAAVLSQLDRLVVSTWLPLSSLGVYGLASLLAQSLVVLVSPLGIALLPWFTQLVQGGQSVPLESAYHKFSQLATVLAGPVAAVLALFPAQVLFAWTGDLALADQARHITPLLATGSFCLALMVVPNGLSLAHGWTSLNVAVGFVALVVFAPLTAWLAVEYGATGCAWAWLFLHSTTLLVYVPLLHRRLLTGSTRRWGVRDTGAPLLAAISVCALARWVTPVQLPPAYLFVWLGFVWLAACLAACVAAPDVRRQVFGLARWAVTRFVGRRGYTPAAASPASSSSCS